MKSAVIYTKSNCPQCDQLKSIVEQRGYDVTYEKITAENIEALRAAGAKSAPVILMRDGTLVDMKTYLGMMEA